MFKIAYHSSYVHPLPNGHRFPMVKYELIAAQLRYEAVVPDTAFFTPEPADLETISLAHVREYCSQLLHLTLPSAMIRRIGFPLSEQLIARELRIVQGTITGCRFAMEDGVAFNVAGGTHHAGSDWGEGFCLLNDQAIAACDLLHRGASKQVLIIDLDVHQGNGTAEIFNGEPRVFTFSMHGRNNFPFHKEHSDLDISLADGTSDREYLETLEQQLDVIFEKVKPDFVFYQSGVDVLSTDKLGRLNLSRAGCRRRDELVFNKCLQANVPLQVSMGGGYSPQVRDIVDAHCNTFKAAVHFFD
ncbi:histone deacetylase [Parapedobacter lycopersici]|uniref:histone deacetylase family protein n=1 Tax=Parapedobacter lycopersici TaxID=1864939 RepID=UPI00333E52C8